MQLWFHSPQRVTATFSAPPREAGPDRRQKAARQPLFASGSQSNRASRSPSFFRQRMNPLHSVRTAVKLKHHQSCWHAAVFCSPELAYMPNSSTSGPATANLIYNFLSLRIIDVEATAVSGHLPSAKGKRQRHLRVVRFWHVILILFDTIFIATLFPPRSHRPVPRKWAQEKILS